uniref:Gfo/Idh/MocA-like oxidoreductase N-terminal domain-containing protein n=1 Tax=Eucampia antarctica TaxID=49252 RepID=A0A7S2RWI7_9STRA|mmetsp:Transcript_27830/g.26639  ORF Transcript_27830/g.26639 Transcript_27830/m.26639 type:complete len:444 (+) Transcript_27830:107-1438(+)|eukprot:CAMPEP_0197826016 /NCGR_PEP_ID=MMETSP1437-20131217/3027_1 /TAXON_ID=49252 ORGANISM="Eucampia antarctica, Strain CCMP1452" /NCGR_SAMPLE_ID=MMETSP1437 /ASSEMBLY_ACC=CAM_ASM_001096 /LENGTH=443 /DNA_ID=CAMNT_0043426261 /DNA_START=60 /DNA_END=1391 /DNA_ORIENTATION=+
MSDGNNDNKINVLMVGTGEYTTGYVGGTAADSDKGAGVVALTMFDLRRRGKVDRVAMCGVNGKKFPGIREHMEHNIGKVYKDMDLRCDTFPKDTEVNAKAYVDAVGTCKEGDVAVIFTPDDTHFDIAMECIKRKMHVMVTKPIVQTLEDHLKLAKAAQENNVLVGVEVHKRLDPFYADSRDRVRSGQLGNFQYMYAYMSQPKHQLDTFQAWASNKSSDISYYLNSHHIDFSEWTLAGIAKPIRVTATSSTGIATERFKSKLDIEDSITLTVQWQNINNNNDDNNNTAPSLGCAVYTSSWVAPKSDVHSQQRFFYMGSKGEINVDQAHRGCTVAVDDSPYASVNPLFMKYTPTNGYFAGQNSYGVRSFENFIDACRTCNESSSSRKQPSDFDDGSIATVHTTLQGTAILEAGRLSLDADGQPMDIIYESSDSAEPTGIQPHIFQ